MAVICSFPTGNTIDIQLNNAGWDIIARNEYLPNSTVAVKEALMKGNTI